VRVMVERRHRSRKSIDTHSTCQRVRWVKPSAFALGDRELRRTGRATADVGV